MNVSTLLRTAQTVLSTSLVAAVGVSCLATAHASAASDAGTSVVQTSKEYRVAAPARKEYRHSVGTAAPSRKEYRHTATAAPSRKEYRRSVSVAPSRKEYRRSVSAAPSRKEYRHAASAAPSRKEYRHAATAAPSRKEYRHAATAAPSREEYRHAVHGAAPRLQLMSYSVATSSSDRYAAQVLRLVNRSRANHHLHRLSSIGCAQRRAVRWSRHLASTQSFRHQSMKSVMKSCDARYAGETLGRGTVSARRLVRLWLDSTPHRRVLLSHTARRVGLGATRDSQGRWVVAADFVRL